MSTAKYFDRIACLALALALVLTLLFAGSEALGLPITAAHAAPGYVDRLFDTSYVHTLDIVMDDWDGFLATCENEEYSPCAVVIDGEAERNVGIRAKGNTSLQQVSRYGNDRYSFKIEFDHYDSANTWHGLDKLSLNNLIQDDSMMKDYLVYQLMRDYGVAAPLASFVWVTVNGEDWGLYLAVEAVEDAFLTRNYGSTPGALYKPDSADMGGGRGNGRDFDMEDFRQRMAEEGIERPETPTGELPQMPDGEPPELPTQGEMPSMPESEPPAMPENGVLPQMADGEAPARPQGGLGMPNGERPASPAGDMGPGGSVGEPQQEPDGEQAAPSVGGTDPGMPDGERAPISATGETARMPGAQGFSGRGGMHQTAETATGETAPMPGGRDFGGRPNGGGPGERNGRGGPNMMADDVLLKYSSDDPADYPNIFDNAKTDVTAADEQRLLAALKTLNGQSNEAPAAAVDTEAVLRYFIVHGFVCNGDSYTGSIVHNYYLREADGRLSMIPWDYNLAFGNFGGFGGIGGGSAADESITAPVTSGTVEDRPMLAWIFADAGYTAEYYTMYQQFIDECVDGGRLDALIADTAALIAPYVEKDPTKFCTVEAFETGVESLRTFCAGRLASVQEQLAQVL